MGDVIDWIVSAFNWFQGVLDHLIVIGFLVTFLALGVFGIAQAVQWVKGLR